MEMDTDAEETLRKLASGGSMDYSTWPLLLATVVSHIEKTAHHDFPIPRIPQPTVAAPPLLPEPRFLAPLPPSSDPAEPTSSSSDIDPPANTNTSGNDSAGPSSQETDKENAAPANAPASTSPTSEPPPAPELEPGTLPPQITAMVAEITGVLNENFHTYPPHTIQRLAELVLEPRKHYRSLPSYLHAVDRVVHVTSGNNIYPLPPAIPDMSHMHINGVTEATGAQEDSSDPKPEQPAQAIWASSSTGGAPIGSDEALGGALLTPIPWLARRAANGGGDGSSESGESSTLGSEAGGTSLAVGQGAGSNTSANSSPTSQQRQGRQFEMQVRTESTETIDGPNGMGSIETVSVSINGISSLSAAQQQRVITQGELIRQEQRAGVVPVSQLARSGPIVVTSNPAASSTAGEDGADTTMGEGEGEGEAQKDTSSEKSDEDMADEDEAPHARGPDIIGAADMGPQKTGSSSTFSISHGGNTEVRGIDVEAAVGRKHESQIPMSLDQSEGAAASDDSDSAAVLTPASSDVESATAADPTEQTVEGDSSKDGAVDEKTTADPLPEGMELEPKSATLSARSSPVKREADSDISEAESGAKRLKSATLEEQEAPSADDTTPAVEEAEIASPKPAAAAAAAGEDEAEATQPESTREEGEGQAGETDAAAPAEREPPASTSDDKPASQEETEKPEDAP
ncbi:hypothetical protein N0V82_002618 [Gnomoniopsis sp. IMI 355080]|nr:hypothetical protein N0V82_002618 [Gnomoniopsis sp. IMI 355080]